MKFEQALYLTAATLLCVVAMGCAQAAIPEAATAGDEATSIPQFKVDPFWPKPLPNNWLGGEIAGIAVDADDHILVLQRPGTLDEGELGAAQSPPISVCCMPAPPVLEFDAEGNLLASWGGPGEGYDWPGIEHGLAIDYKGNVWIGGEGSRDPATGTGHSLHGDDEPMCKDHQVLKFSRDGKFLLQIGTSGRTGGSNNTEFLGHPADMEVDPETNEVYVTDGYLNRRVIVFDADTGSTSGTGEPTETCRTIPISAPTIRALPPHSSSVPSCTTFGSQTTGSYISRIASTTVFRFFKKTAPS